MIAELRVRPRDPLVVRDGRPFGIGQGSRMYPLEWPYPSTVTGALRSMLGSLSPEGFDRQAVKELKEVRVHGPLAYAGNQLFVVAPKDALLRPSDESVFALRPMETRPGEGTYPTDASTLPLCLPPGVEDEFKPGKIAALWSMRKLTEWLVRDSEAPFAAPVGDDALEFPKPDFRTHVRMDRKRGIAEDQMLFQTAGLAFSDDLQISVRVESSGRYDKYLSEILSQLFPMGGERRLVRWESANLSAWICPPEIRREVSQAKYVRMILATPAIFGGGWLPDWLSRGIVPGSDVHVRLVAAQVDRWRPVSGWSIETGKSGARPVRRMVPAGSVYFLELENAASLPVDRLWLQPMSDKDEDCDHGFGLAVWGTWNPHQRLG